MNLDNFQQAAENLQCQSERGTDHSLTHAVHEVEKELALVQLHVKLRLLLTQLDEFVSVRNEDPDTDEYLRSPAKLLRAVEHARLGVEVAGDIPSLSPENFVTRKERAVIRYCARLLNRLHALYISGATPHECTEIIEAAQQSFEQVSHVQEPLINSVRTHFESLSKRVEEALNADN